MGLFGGQKSPEEIAGRIPPGNHLTKGWPVLHFSPVPKFDEATWNLSVFGLCDEPYSLTYSELKSLPTVDVDADFHCVTTWSKLDNTWTGVPFRTLYERSKPREEAKWVIAHCEYGYTSNLSLEAMLDEDVLVAWAHDGEDLEPDHGYPLRLVVPKRYAWKSAKWLRSLELVDSNKRGFWEERGYHTHADPWVEERYSYQEGPGADIQP